MRRSPASQPATPRKTSGRTATLVRPRALPPPQDQALPRHAALRAPQTSAAHPYHMLWHGAVGEVPLEWYKDELHIGYDREGRKVTKGPRRDKLDALLARNDGGSAWRTVYDEYNGEEITLSKEEMRMIQRIREGKFPHVEVR